MSLGTTRMGAWGADLWSAGWPGLWAGPSPVAREAEPEAP